MCHAALIDLALLSAAELAALLEDRRLCDRCRMAVTSALLAQQTNDEQ